MFHRFWSLVKAMAIVPIVFIFAGYIVYWCVFALTFALDYSSGEIGLSGLQYYVVFGLVYYIIYSLALGFIPILFTLYSEDKYILGIFVYVIILSCFIINDFHLVLKRHAFTRNDFDWSVYDSIKSFVFENNNGEHFFFFALLSVLIFYFVFYFIFRKRKA